MIKHVAWLLLVLLGVAGCGYHLVGQGGGSAIPQGVESAALWASSDATGKALLAEFQHVWVQYPTLPMLSEGQGEKHVVLRIEQAKNTFVPVAFDALGLAIQYRLSMSGILNMYQEQALLWSSGTVLVSANVFGDSASSANNPSIVEAERETLTEQLHVRWAEQAMSRLKSGF